MKQLKRMEGRKKWSRWCVKILDKSQHSDPEQIYDFNESALIKNVQGERPPQKPSTLSDTTFKTKPPFSIEIVIHIPQDSIDSLFYLSLFHWVVNHSSSFLPLHNICCCFYWNNYELMRTTFVFLRPEMGIIRIGFLEMPSAQSLNDKDARVGFLTGQQK